MSSQLSEEDLQAILDKWVQNDDTTLHTQGQEGHPFQDQRALLTAAPTWPSLEFSVQASSNVDDFTGAEFQQVFTSLAQCIKEYLVVAADRSKVSNSSCYDWNKLSSKVAEYTTFLKNGTTAKTLVPSLLHLMGDDLPFHLKSNKEEVESLLFSGKLLHVPPPHQVPEGFLNAFMSWIPAQNPFWTHIENSQGSSLGVLLDRALETLCIAYTQQSFGKILDALSSLSTRWQLPFNFISFACDPRYELEVLACFLCMDRSTSDSTLESTGISNISNQTPFCRRIIKRCLTEDAGHRISEVPPATSYVSLYNKRGLIGVFSTSKKVFLQTLFGQSHLPYTGGIKDFLNADVSRFEPFFVFTAPNVKKRKSNLSTNFANFETVTSKSMVVCSIVSLLFCLEDPLFKKKQIGKPYKVILDPIAPSSWLYLSCKSIKELHDFIKTFIEGCAILKNIKVKILLKDQNQKTGQKHLQENQHFSSSDSAESQRFYLFYMGLKGVLEHCLSQRKGSSSYDGTEAREFLLVLLKTTLNAMNDYVHRYTSDVWPRRHGAFKDA